jgi:hypothetical protein
MKKSFKILISTILGAMTFKSGQFMKAFFSEPDKKAYKCSGSYKMVSGVKWETHKNDSHNLVSDFKNVSRDIRKAVDSYNQQNG